MPYLIDGNNLIGRARRGKASDGDRSALIRELSDRLRRTRAQVVLVFDGTGAAASLGSLSIRFSGPRTADDAIVRELSLSRNPRDLTVVTADRDLARRARDAGSQVAAPEEFWSRFGSAGSGRELRSSDPPPVDVEEWTHFFEDEKNRGR